MAGYYFRLPQIIQLTEPQQTALYELKQIALSGGPGTGKSVVSLWRHINNLRNKKNSLLLTYTTTLKMYFIGACRNEARKSDIEYDVKIAFHNAPRNIKTSKSGMPNKIDNLYEVIIDEAQDLPKDYYERLKQIISKVSYGADKSQTLYPEKSSDPEELKKIFPENEDYPLDENFRSTQRIMKLAKAIFPDAYIPQSTIDKLANNVGELPVILISESNWNQVTSKFELSNKKQDNAIISIVKQFSTAATNNIAILAPWKKNVKYFDELLKSNGFSDYSVYYGDEIDFPNGAEEIKNIHITTFKSAKGLEFDVVIIPNFDSISRIDANIVIEGITEENKEELKNAFETFGIHKHIPEKKRIINLQTKESIIDDIRKKVEAINGIEMRVDMTWKDLYVGVTRARSNLYLITSQAMPQFNSLVEQSKLD
ncbi:MAG: DUF2075 domain-containing protein [Flavobacterium piscis]|nr:DUF2075 domain-containing protein [Flavobacterium piscis]